MFNAGFISIANDLIYSTLCLFSFSTLSQYLLEIYLKEADDYASKIFLYASVKKVLIKKSLERSFNLSNSCYDLPWEVRDYTPIFLESFLKKKVKIKCILHQKYTRLLDTYNNITLGKHYLTKSVTFIRYLDFFIFGFLTNLSYTHRLFRKYLFFIRSKLHFDLNQTRVCILPQTPLYFLGFRIEVINNEKKNYISVFSVQKDENFNNILLNRLVFYKKKTINLQLNRLNFELINYFNNVLKVSFSKKVFQHNKIWVSIFQKEAIRASRIGKLPFTRDDFWCYSKSLNVNLKEFYLDKKFVYVFDSYIFKTQYLISQALKEFKYSLDFTLVSFDTLFHKFLLEYNKSLFFFYNETYFKNSYKTVWIFLTF